MDTSRHLQNPYVVGNALSDPAGYGFYGRRAIYDFIGTRLNARRRPAILLFGHRRIGKTSVLRQMPRYLPADYCIVFFDMQGQHDDPFPDIVRGLAYEIATAAGLAWDDLDALDPGAFKSKFMPQVFARLGGEKHRLVILIDEFDTLDVQEPEAKRFLGFLQRWMSEEQEVGFVFVVGRRPETISKLFQNLSTITYAIGRLDRSETEEVIRSPARGVLEYSDAAVERIWELTAGHPLATQLICFELWSRWSQAGEVPPGAVDDVLPAALEAGSNQLNQIYDDLELSIYRLFLSALAESADAHGSAELAAIRSALQRYQVDLAPNLPEIRQTLLTRDIIAESSGCFRFTVELIRLWVARNRPLRRLSDDAALVNEEAYRAYRVAEDFRLSALRAADDGARLGLLGQAAGNYRLALDRNPMLVAARVGLVQVLTERQAYAEAATEAERLYLVDLGYGPLYRDTIRRWAEQLESTKDFAKALPVYERIVTAEGFRHDEELQRRYQAAAAAYGEELLREGRYDEALEAFTKAGAAKAVARTQKAKGESLLREGRYDEALAWFSRAGAHDAIAKAKARKQKDWAALTDQAAACRAKENWDGCLDLVAAFLLKYPGDREAEELAQQLRRDAGSYWVARAEALLVEGDGNQALHYLQKVGQPDDSVLVRQAQQAAADQEKLAQFEQLLDVQQWTAAAQAVDQIDARYVAAAGAGARLQRAWRSAILASPAPSGTRAGQLAAEMQSYLDRYPDDGEVRVKLDAARAELQAQTQHSAQSAIGAKRYDLAVQQLVSADVLGEYPRLLVAVLQTRWAWQWLWRLPLLAGMAAALVLLYPGLGVGPDFPRAWALSLCAYFLVSGLINNGILQPLLFRRWRQLPPTDAAAALKLRRQLWKNQVMWLRWGDAAGMLLALVLAALLSLPATLFLPQSVPFWWSLGLSAVMGCCAGLLVKGFEILSPGLDGESEWASAMASVAMLVWIVVLPAAYGLPILIYGWLAARYFAVQFTALFILILVSGFLALVFYSGSSTDAKS